MKILLNDHAQGAVLLDIDEFSVLHNTGEDGEQENVRIILRRCYNSVVTLPEVPDIDAEDDSGQLIVYLGDHERFAKATIFVSESQQLVIQSNQDLKRDKQREAGKASGFRPNEIH